MLLRRIVLQYCTFLMTLPHVVGFWHEHGGRATLPSIAACIPTILPEWLEELGNWSSKSSVAYVCTHLRKVAMIQTAVAYHLHTRRLSATDIGEDGPYAQWAKFLCSRGSTQDEAIAQTSKLAAATALLFVSASSSAIAPATPAAEV